MLRRLLGSVCQSYDMKRSQIARSTQELYSKKKENIQIGFQYYYYMWAYDAGLLLSISMGYKKS